MAYFTLPDPDLTAYASIRQTELDQSQSIFNKKNKNDVSCFQPFLPNKINLSACIYFVNKVVVKGTQYGGCNLLANMEYVLTKIGGVGTLYTA